MITNAAIYVRISSDKSGEGLGVARQESGCRELAERKGWSIGGVYTDNDISAASGKLRPSYTRMLADIEDGVINGVVVWDLDRLHRRPVELEHFIDLSDRHGIKLANVGGDTDISTPQGRLTARIKGDVAKYETEQNIVRLRAKQDQLADAGLPSNGGLRPFGYRQDRMNLVEDEAKVILEIADRILARESLASIARDLNERGIPTVRGGPWLPTSLTKMMIKPRLAGLRTHRGVIVGPAAWPAVLERDVWGAVCTLLTAPDRRTNIGSTARKYLLVGLARCGTCDSMMQSHQSTHGGRQYACPESHAVRSMAPVDALITDLVVGRLGMADAIDLVAPRGDENLAELSDKADVLRMRIQQVVDEFTDDPTITPMDLRAVLAGLRAKLTAIESELASSTQGSVLDGLVGVENVAAVWAGLPLSRKRAVIDLLMSIRIMPTRKGGQFDPRAISITWR